MIRERIQHIQYSKSRNGIVAAGRQGGLYFLNLDLEPVQSSQATQFNQPLTMIAIHGDFVFSKDIVGRITRWNLQTLRPIDIILSGEYRDDEELDEEDDVIASVNHAMAVSDGKLYALNGYGQILELGIEPFQLQRILDPNKESFCESIETGKPNQHVLSDFRGNLFFGDLATGEFEKKVHIDEGPIHCVRYDRRHDRFWATTDNRGGFAVVEANGVDYQLYKMTNDDVEWISFNETATLAYLACFDHHLYIYSNENKDVELKQVVGPFKFQLKQVLHVADDLVYVLLESGEIYRINQHGAIEKTFSYGGNCVWALDAHPEDDSLVYCALEDGSVSVVRYGTGVYNAVEVAEVKRHSFSFGRVRRAKPLKDGSYVGVTTSGTVFRATQHGNLMWYKKILGICRDVDISPDCKKALVGTEANLAVEFDLETGQLLREYHLEAPVWAVCYDPKGLAMLGTRRMKAEIYNPEDGQVVARMEFLENIKRFRRLENGNILMNGPEGITEVDTNEWKVVKRWSEWIFTTCENAILVDGHIHAVSYNMFMTSYRYDSTELVDKQVSVPDFSKGMAARKAENGETILMVGGRGPYLSLYRLKDGVPRKARELYLHTP